MSATHSNGGRASWCAPRSGRPRARAGVATRAAGRRAGGGASPPACPCTLQARTGSQSARSCTHGAQLTDGTAAHVHVARAVIGRRVQAVGGAYLDQHAQPRVAAPLGARLLPTAAAPPTRDEAAHAAAVAARRLHLEDVAAAARAPLALGSPNETCSGLAAGDACMWTRERAAAHTAAAAATPRERYSRQRVSRTCTWRRQRHRSSR